jgi:hypothetical protein
MSGRAGSAPIANGRLRGDTIAFTAGGVEYTGRVAGDTMEGTMTSGGSQSAWRATRGSR